MKPPKASDETRAACIALRVADPHRWTSRTIADGLRMSLGWVNGVLKSDEAVAAVKRAEDKAPPPPAAPVETPEATATAEGSADALRATLAQMNAEAATTKDPVQRGVLLKNIAAVTKDLARVQLAVSRQKEPERDAGMLRAGHAAADKLRGMLEEAIGEVLDGGRAA